MSQPSNGQPSYDAGGQQPYPNTGSQYPGSQPQYPGQQPYSSSAQPNGTGQLPAPYFQENPKPNNNGKWWAVGAGVVVVLFAIVAATTIILLNKNSSDDSKANSSSNTDSTTTTTSQDVATVDPEEFAKEYADGVFYSDGRFLKKTSMICPNSPESRDDDGGRTSMESDLASMRARDGVTVRTITLTSVAASTTSSTSDSAEVTLTLRLTIVADSVDATSVTAPPQEIKQKLSLKKRNSSWCVHDSAEI